MIMTKQTKQAVTSNSVLGAAIAKAFSAVDGARAQACAALQEAFPSQPSGMAGYTRYSEIQEAARNAYIAERSALNGKTLPFSKEPYVYDAKRCRKAFATTWSRAMGDAGLRPINAKGEVSTQGAGGGKPKAAEKSEEAAKPQPATQRDLITALFGHCDDGLMEAMLYATAHELLFVQWAKASAAAMNK